MNLKVISRNVGSALLVSAVFMLISIGVSIYDGNDSALTALIISFTLTFVVGIFPYIFVSKQHQITIRDGYMIVLLSWLLSFIFGMLPYALYGGPFTIENAWFESVSGFTTTGATILEDVEALPRSLLFWRTSTHFIGGLGIVVFLLIVIPSSNSVRSRLTNMEVSSLSKDGYQVKANKTVYIFAYVYIGICVLAFLAYWACGMSPFDAINHAMSICATGGFSTRNLSLGYFDSDLIYIVTIFFMYVASIHFGLVFLAIVNRSFKYFNNPILKFYTSYLLIASFIVSVSLKTSGIDQSWGRALMDGTFHVFSYASTTGFAISDNAAWHEFPNMILLCIGMICGMAGSTTGGLKSDRVVVFLKGVARQIARAIRPNTVIEVRVGKNIVRDDEVYRSILYVALFFLCLLASFFVCLIGPNATDSTFAGVVASLTNVGPAIGSLSSLGNYNAEPLLSKLVYTFDMFLGRVEIYPILAVLMMLFGDRNK